MHDFYGLMRNVENVTNSSLRQYLTASNYQLLSKRVTCGFTFACSVIPVTRLYIFTWIFCIANIFFFLLSCNVPFQSQCLMNKWVECCKHLNIGELWETLKKDQSQILPNLYELKKAWTVSSRNNTIHTVDVPLTMPLSKIKDDVTVWFFVKDIEVETGIQSSSGSTFAKNAFNFLMTKTKVNVPLKQVANKKDELFNDLVNLKQLICYQEQLQNIKVLIQCLTDALWSLMVITVN